MDTNIHTETHSNTHINTEHTVRERKQRPCVLEKPLRGGEQKLYLHSLPLHISHTHTHTPNHRLLLLHTITHTSCAPFREKHLLLLHCAEIRVMGEREGWENKGRRAVPQSCQSSGSSLMHGHTHTDTHTGLLHQRFLDELFQDGKMK